jgi:uncharacterized protein
MWAFQTLLKQNAQVNIVNNDGNSLLHYVVNGIGNSQEFIRKLHSAGIDINLKNKQGQTALDVAKSKNLPRVIDLLIELGANEEKVPEKKVEEKPLKPVN